MKPPPPARPGLMSPEQSGFTLIELMISLSLFALIAVAGLALVDSVLGVQGRTEARLDRLAEVQRTMFILASDLNQLAPGDIAGGGTILSFRRTASGFGGPPQEVRYTLAGGALVRTAGGAPQKLLSGVTAARWRFFDQGWRDRWPPSEDLKTQWPAGIEVELRTGNVPGVNGAIRRVVAIPARPREEP